MDRRGLGASPPSPGFEVVEHPWHEDPAETLRTLIGDCRRFYAEEGFPDAGTTGYAPREDRR
jgi:hypothetical protein